MFDLNSLVRKNILELEPYSSARSEYTGTGGIFLDANENPFGRQNRYPDPAQLKLKEKIASLKQLSIQQIFVGNGSDEIIDLAIRIFCDPGKDKVLSFTPTYGMYKVSAAINDVSMLEVALDKDFQIDTECLNVALNTPNLKMIFLCSPNNPTGNGLDNLEPILQQFKGIVLVDEAYIDFSDRTSLVQKLSEYPQLIVTQTLSKAWGLAAARIGIAFAAPEIIALFSKAKPPYNVSTPDQEAAVAALSDQSTYETHLKTMVAERQKLNQLLSQSPLVLKIYPSEANFLLIETINAPAIYEGLLKQGIIVRNRTKEIPNCIRISIGTPVENKQLMAAWSRLVI